jgi:hypothetical protein
MPEETICLLGLTSGSDAMRRRELPARHDGKAPLSNARSGPEPRAERAGRTMADALS